MNTQILTRQTTSVSEFKKNPCKSVQLAEGEPVAVLSHNKPSFYAVPTSLFEAFIDAIEDLEDIEIAKKRAGQKSIAVSLDDL